MKIDKNFFIAAVLLYISVICLSTATYLMSKKIIELRNDLNNTLQEVKEIHATLVKHNLLVEK